MSYNFEERYKEIREQLIAQGYANKHITYSEFLALYELYKEEISEKEFVSILGISYSNWQTIKHRNQKTVILKKDKTDEDREKLKQEIVSTLIERGYQNKSIDYTELLKLYEPYRIKLKESEFASILGISYGNWQIIKHRNQKAVILKKDKTDEDREKLEQEIVSELIERGYQNKRIDYTEFLKLYEPYRRKLKESEFASILGISYGNWQNIKHKNQKAIILKKDKTDEEKKKLEQEIVSELIERGYQNKNIDYAEFLKLYEPYRRKLKESEFASILGISYGNWQNIKHKNQKAIILKKDKTDEEKKKLEQEIVSELIERGYQNKSIDYAEFLKLYEPYRTKVKESEFANILRISYTNLRNIKQRKQKAIILKKDMTEEEKKELEQEIVSELIERGYQNKSIDYAEFLKLYEPYKRKVKEREFANILGVNWQSIKHRGTKSTINFEYKYSLRILYLFGENKEYDLKYFEEVSKNFGLPIYKILEIITKERTNLEELINILHTRGKIFVGQTRISNSFLQKYGEIISEDIHKYSKQIGKKLHTGMYAEDFAQEAILWVIGKKGNIERNFEEGLALERIIKYAKINCKYMHFKIFSQKKVVSLDEGLSENGKITRLKRVKSKGNVQDLVEKREKIEISEDDTPIIIIQRCLSNGMNREEALSFVMKKFNISKKELLETLTEELSKRNKIKVTETGEVYLGTRDE